MDLKDVLNSLCSAVGPSGREGPAIKETERYLSAYAKTRTDSFGNLIGEIDADGPHIMLDAHIDEIGMIVTDIDSDGFLKVNKCGGIDPRILPDSEAIIWGKEEVKGVFCNIPPHLADLDDAASNAKLEEMSIDIGMNSREAKELIDIGDRVSFMSQPEFLLNGRVAAKSLDNRAGAAAILKCLDILHQKENKCKLTILFSAQEEVGCRGAKVAAFDIFPDEAISLDVSFANSPDTPKHKCGNLGQGPMIGIAPTLSRRITEELKYIAEEQSIPFQLEVMDGKTGTNADVVSVTKSGVETGLISIPLRYMHTSSEIIDMSDIDNSAKLLAEYILRRGGTSNV